MEAKEREEVIVVVTPVGNGDGSEYIKMSLQIDNSGYISLPLYNTTDWINCTGHHLRTTVGITAANLLALKSSVQRGPLPGIIVAMDVGHCPEDVPDFVDKIRQGYDVVVSYRMPEYSTWRNALTCCVSRVGHYLARYLLDLPFTDNCSGMYAFRREALDKILRRPFYSKHYFYDTEMRWHINNLELKWAETPIIAHTGGNTLRPSVLWDAAVNLWRYWRKNKEQS